VAVAELSRTKRVEALGVGGNLGRPERLNALGDRLFIRRAAKAGTIPTSPMASAGNIT